MGTRIGFIWWINMIMMVYNPIDTWKATEVEQQLEATRCTQVLCRCFKTLPFKFFYSMHEIFSQILSRDLMDKYRDMKKSKYNCGLEMELWEMTPDYELMQFKKFQPVIMYIDWCRPIIKIEVDANLPLGIDVDANLLLR